MKDKLFAIAIATLMIVSPIAGSVAAQVPTDPDPGDPDVDPDEPEVDPGDPDADVPGQTPDADDASGEVAFDEVFVPIQRFECPLDPTRPQQDPFVQDVLSGETSWTTASKAGASDGCIASWGEGSYTRGSEAALASPGMPTGHLAASSATGQTVNTVAQRMAEQGFTAETIAQTVGGLSTGCDIDNAFTRARALQIAFATCQEVLSGSSALLDVPSDPAGLGALYLEMHHAYKFSDPDQNQRAPDGGWVEVREPGGSWKRLTPIAMFNTARDGSRVLCSITGPPTVGTEALIRESALSGTIETIDDWWRTGEFDFGGGGIGEEIPASPVAPGQEGLPSPLGIVPDSHEQWEQNCLGELQSSYETETEVPVEGQGTGQGRTVEAPPESTQRARPYPGTIENEGPGFVGSTEGSDGRVSFVDHWFDLSPYAGETVEVRFHATGGSGLGTRDGGWWVDDVNVRYTGPPDDLSVRLEAPQDGDSFPPGKTPVDVVVRNLGRTTSDPVTVEIGLGNATETATVPELDPLERHRVTKVMPVPDATSVPVRAELLQTVGAQNQQETAPYSDSYPPNNEATAEIDVGRVHEVSLGVGEVRQEGTSVNATIHVTNDGNEPFTVPLRATLTPVDLNTRNPRLTETVSLGEVASVTVPHGRQANSLGVREPVRPANASFELPGPGVYQFTVTTSEDADARAITFITLDEATPTSFETTLGGTVEGETLDTPRDGFELSQDSGAEPLAFQSLLYDPITGPETLHIPRGDHALATFGQELPRDWSPVDVAAGQEVSVVVEEGCRADVLVPGPDGEPQRVGGDFIQLACTLFETTVRISNDQVNNTQGRLDQAARTAEELTQEPREDTASELNATLNNATSEFDLLQSQLDDANQTLGDVTEGFDRRVAEQIGAGFEEANRTIANSSIPGSQDPLVTSARENLTAAGENASRMVNDTALVEELGNVTQRQIENASLAIDQLDRELGQAGSDVAEILVQNDTIRKAAGPVQDEVDESQDLIPDELNPTTARDPAGAQAPPRARSPASIQAWNVRQHHVSIYGIGTEAEGGQGEESNDPSSQADSSPVEQGAVQLRPREDGETVKLEFRHAAQVNASGEFGSKARVVVVPKSGLNLTEEVEQAERLTRDATADLPEPARDVAGTVLFNLLFERLITTATNTLESNQLHRYPQGACNVLDQFGVPLPGGDVPGADAPRQICGQAQVLKSFEDNCPPGGVSGDCEFTDQHSATYLRSQEETTDAIVEEFTRPDGWRNVSIDITSVVENQTTRTHEEGYYVMFDLVTTTDLQDVIASAEAKGNESGSDARVFNADSERRTGLQGYSSRFGYSTGERPLWTVDDPQAYRERDGERQATVRLCDGPSCPDDAISALDTQGWTSLEASASKSSRWSFDPLGGDADSLEPGALVWEGGTGQLVDRSSGLATLVDQENPTPYSVLRSPTIHLGGFDQPVAKMHVKFGQTDIGSFSGEDSISRKCGQARSSGQVSGTIWTKTGWNVRARPVLPNGSLGEAETVHPVGGYDDCSDEGPVPVKFNASALTQSAHSYGLSTGEHVVSHAEPNTNCVSDTNTDPLQSCARTQLQFGHGQPVFALPTDWRDVTFDLSEFEGQAVQLEIHAFGVRGNSFADPLFTGSGRGKLAIDDMKVSEGNPPIDLAVDHDKRRFIAPGSDERFRINLTNEGARAVEQVSIRRTVTGSDRCQVVDPVTVNRRLFDPETGSTGLPPGASVTIQDGQLDWTAPEAENELFRRSLTVSPLDSLPISEAPALDLEHAEGFGLVNVTARDADDCRRNVDVQTTVLEGDPKIRREDGQIRIEGREQSTDGGSSLGAPDAAKIKAVDAHGVESLPTYVVTPPKRQVSDGEVRWEVNGTATAEVLQSAPGSRVHVEATPADPDFRTTTLVLATEDGLEIHRDFESFVLSGLPEGQYFGYVSFGGQDYVPLEFTVPELPEAGSDARPEDNVATLRGETKAIPRLSIAEIDVPAFVNASEEVTFPIRLENTGNVPLENVSAEVEIQPFGFTRTAKQVPLLLPGEVQDADVTLEIPSPKPVRLRVDAASESGVSASTGAGLLAFDKDTIQAETGDHDPWDTGSKIQFGDGTRVPSDVDAPLPLTGTLDLSRSPLSALFLNHSGQLEESYDGVALEWRNGDDTIAHPVGGSLTSSHAGAEPGKRTPAFTGNMTPTRANASDLPGSSAKLVDDVQVSEWKSTGTYQLEVDDAFRTSFWLPTSTFVGDKESAEISSQLRVPLTRGEWCRVTEEMYPESFRVRVLERRLFTESSESTRGWDAKVRLETGSFSQTPGVSAKRIDATPVVPPSDEETTDWTIVTYEVPLSKLRQAVTANAQPDTFIFDRQHWTEHATDNPDHSHIRDDGCELLRNHGNDWPTNIDWTRTKQDVVEGVSGAELVFELRLEDNGLSTGGLDVGWFIGDIDVPDLRSSGNAETSFDAVDLHADPQELVRHDRGEEAPYHLYHHELEDGTPHEVNNGTSHYHHDSPALSLYHHVLEPHEHRVDNENETRYHHEHDDGTTHHHDEQTILHHHDPAATDPDEHEENDGPLEDGMFGGHFEHSHSFWLESALHHHETEPADVDRPDQHYVARGCESPGSSFDFDPRSVAGCTKVETGSVEEGTLRADGDLADSLQHPQIVEFGSRSAKSVYDGTEIPSLTALLQNRTFEVERDTEEDDGGDLVSKGSEGPFRYVDAVALVDLRSGTEGTFAVNLTASSNQGIAQVVAAPVDPGARASESAPSRVNWRSLDVYTKSDEADGQPKPLPFCDHGSVSELGSRPAQTPLNATQDRIVGALTGDDRPHHFKLDPIESDETTTTCADLGPVSGELALVGVRMWLPQDGDEARVENASAWMVTPEPRQLKPQLRGLTDDTVNEGTYTLDDAALLTMAPPFSHRVEAEFSGTETLESSSGSKEVLKKNAFSDLRINVTEPGLDSRWRIEANLSLSFPDGSTTVTNETQIELPASSYEGSQTIEVPWERLRESFRTVDNARWIADHPVLPANVTQVGIEVRTTPERLVNPRQGCPADLAELDLSQDLDCRLLADLVSSDDDFDRAWTTEAGLNRGPGVQSLDIRPDRAVPGTPRTAVIEMVNPTSSPREIKGNLTVVDKTTGTELKRTSVPEQIVREWDNATVRVSLRLPTEEPTRAVVVAEIGDQTVEDDYRTTPVHESKALLDAGAFETTDKVHARSSDAIPPLPGVQSDGIGYRFEAPAGQDRAHVLRTNEIDVGEDPEGDFTDATAQSIKEMLRDDDRMPVLTFQHQRQLRDNGEGDFSYVFVTACRVGGCGSGDGSGQNDDIVVLDMYGPRASHPRQASLQPATQNSESVDRCSGSQSTGGQGQSATAEGIENFDGDSQINGVPILRGSTGSGTIQPDVLTEWRTVVAPLDDLYEKRLSEDAEVQWSDSDEIKFNVVLATCQTRGPSTMIVDNLALGSARPLATLAADDIQIRPGAEKRYRLTVSNPGVGSDEFHVVPASKIPDGWDVTVERSDGSVLYDRASETLDPLYLEEGETKDAVLTVQIPGDQAGGQDFDVPLTAYAVDAPGLRSSGGLNNSVRNDPKAHQDPGKMTLESSREDQPDLLVAPGSVKIKEAEVGRQAKIQFKVVNQGDGRAKDVPIRVGVDGPSGFTELTGPDGGTVTSDFGPNTRKFFTFTWKPSEPGVHRLRILADPGEDAVRLLVGDQPQEFFGIVQETSECNPQAVCNNLLDHRFEVKPLQKPELSVTVESVPDRIAVGNEGQLKITVRNDGGRVARDATLTLSENGLLPILDTLTVELPPIGPGNQTVLTPDWRPVTPGDILVLASVSAPGEFTGQRSDGSSAGFDNDAAIPVLVDRARTSMTLSGAIQTEPGRGHVVEATVINDGTSALHVAPETVRKAGVLLSPVLEQPLEVPAGEQRRVPLLGFALLGTAPGTVELDLPIDQGQVSVEVTVVEAPGARVVLDERPIEPGTTDVQARVINEGNVPLEGALDVAGPGISGSTPIDVPVDSTTNVSVPVTVHPGTEPGLREFATIVRSDGASIRGQHRLQVLEAPAASFDVRAEEAALVGSSLGELVVRNIGNQLLDGRLRVSGPASLDGSPLVELAPGESVSHQITWLNSANRSGTVEVVTVDGEVVDGASLDPGERAGELELLRVSTRPGVNLRAGMEVQVVGSVENTGQVPVRNATLGVTVDGELFQTFELEKLGAGETTVVSQALELPGSGELTIGLVDLAAFQRGEAAGPATTIEAAEGSFGIGTIAEVPTIPWTGVVFLVALVAAGVRRR